MIACFFILYLILNKFKFDFIEHTLKIQEFNLIKN